ncbi:MAG TPA: hypothetical protein VIV60_02810 [Polyangiaceae bacterium]
MANSRSPELQRAKTILDEAALAPGARERIYWGVVHKPARLARGRWRVSLMVFGWLTAASAAYGIGRIAYLTLPNHAQSAATSATPLPSTQPMNRRAAGRGRLDPAAQKPDVASAKPAPIPEATQRTTIATAPPSTASADAIASTALDTRVRAAPVTSVAASRAAPVSDGASELSLQVTDYKQAVALLNQQPELALERLYAHRRHWPNSAIAHEVDLRIIQSLVAQGHIERARAAARSFLQRYPGSERSAEVSRIAETND